MEAEEKVDTSENAAQQGTGTAPPESPAAESSGSPQLRKQSRWEVYYPRHTDSDVEAIHVASFPMIVYFWPTMLAFLVCGLVQWATKVPEPTIGWIAYSALAFNMIVIVTDLDQKKFVICLLAVVVLGLLGVVSNMKDFGIASSIAGFLGGIQPIFGTSAYFLVGLTLLSFFFFGMLQPLFNYWRFEPNEFTHYIQPFGRDQSVPRQNSTVTREVPDVLELLLTFGGGTLAIRREGDVVARIEHVPFLGRRMKAIERMLGATRVRTINSD